MKYFAVLILGLLADGSFAVNFKCNDEVSNKLLVKAYRRATECAATPTGEFDFVINNFKEEYIKSAVTFGSSLLHLVYGWAHERSEELISAAENRSCALEKCIKSNKDSNVTPTCLEYTLEDLTKQFHIFLELCPGNEHIKHQPLPDVPPSPGTIVPVVKLSANDIFVNISPSLNGYLENFYVIAVDVHREGWKILRRLFNTFQTQYRNEFLNDWILEKYRLIVDKVLQSAKYIQSHVRPELWESFKNACDRIVAASDDYRALKIRKNC